MLATSSADRGKGERRPLEKKMGRLWGTQRPGTSLQEMLSAHGKRARCPGNVWEVFPASRTTIVAGARSAANKGQSTVRLARDSSCGWHAICIASPS